MSGNRYLLDTNAVSALLKGEIQLVQLLQGEGFDDREWVAIVIPVLYFRSCVKHDRGLKKSVQSGRSSVNRLMASTIPAE
ncbi:MAG: hypothetical protein KME18_17120 [Phormidium tanganyikae FI6-MK23]|jgi:predicted nucleic acid-binding protein|nr:hypothetical protein [Phormidium tanganyikae FI6-MK23]